MDEILDNTHGCEFDAQIIDLLESNSKRLEESTGGETD
jgi:hypothetical protein